MPSTQQQQQRQPDFLIRIGEVAAFLHENRNVRTLRSNRAGAIADAEGFVATHGEITKIVCDEVRTSRAARAGRTTHVEAGLRSELVRVASVHARRECEIPLPDVLFVAAARWMRIEQRELLPSSSDARTIMSAAGQLFARAKRLPGSFADLLPPPNPANYDLKLTPALSFTNPVLGNVVPDRVRVPASFGAVETYTHFLKHVMHLAVQEVVHFTGQKTKNLEAALTKVVRFWTTVYLRESKGKDDIPPLRLVLEAATARWVAGSVGINWRLRNDELTEIVVGLYHGDIRDRIGFMGLVREEYREGTKGEKKGKSKDEGINRDEEKRPAKIDTPVTRAYDFLTEHIQKKPERYATYRPILDMAAALDVIGAERVTVTHLIDEADSMGAGYTATACAAAGYINQYLEQGSDVQTTGAAAKTPRNIANNLTYCFRLIDSCHALRGITGFPADTDTLGLLGSVAFPESFIAELRWMDGLRQELSAPPKLGEGQIKDFIQRHRLMQRSDPDYVSAASKLAHAGYKNLPTPKPGMGAYTAQLVRYESARATKFPRNWNDLVATAKQLDDDPLAAVDVLNAVDGKFERAHTIAALLAISHLYKPHVESPTAEVMSRAKALKAMVAMQNEGRLALKDVLEFLELQQGQSGGLIAKANFVSSLLVAGSHRNDPTPPAASGAPSISGLDRLLSQAKVEFHPANTRTGKPPSVRLMESVLHMHDREKGRLVESVKGTIGGGRDIFDCAIVATFEPRALRDSFGYESKVSRRIAVLEFNNLTSAIGTQLNGSAGRSPNNNGLYAKFVDKCERANCIPIVLIHAVEDEGRRYQLMKRLDEDVLQSVLQASRSATVPTFVYRQQDGYVVANFRTIDYGTPDPDVVGQITAIRP